MRDIRRHKERGRCGKKGGKGLGRPARFVPGTPENRPSLDGMTNYATYVGTGEPADFVNLRKRLKK